MFLKSYLFFLSFLSINISVSAHSLTWQHCVSTRSTIASKGFRRDRLGFRRKRGERERERERESIGTLPPPYNPPPLESSLDTRDAKQEIKSKVEAEKREKEQ